MLFNIIAMTIPGDPPPDPKSVVVFLLKSIKSIICAESIIWRSIMAFFDAVL